jgi:hypothetical protein
MTFKLFFHSGLVYIKILKLLALTAQTKGQANKTNQSFGSVGSTCLWRWAAKKLCFVYFSDKVMNETVRIKV